ncbi:unannotated protein [freshwater metagenome]|uniref:Unannotated protein n=1 Tax=freshwater metagenome TaxID=449393 RepID=A0A6J7RIS8_9ZZZZ
MRDTKGFMQIEVAHISPELSGLGKPDKRIEVCAIDVDLSTVMMNKITDIGDCCFKNAVRRWVSNHERCKLI